METVGGRTREEWVRKFNERSGNRPTEAGVGIIFDQLLSAAISEREKLV